MTCAACGEDRPVMARGMDLRCYARELRAGRLNEWQSLHHDYDEIVVQAIIDGRRKGGSYAENRAAIAVLLDRGQFSYSKIAKHVGVTNRTVERVAAKRRAAL